MNGGTIANLLSSDPYTRRVFNGFWFPDLKPIISKLPALIILNTDKSSGPGEHWCAAYFSPSTHCEFFDPLGEPPENTILGYSFIHHLSSFSKTIEFNTEPVQDLEAKTCGPHCIFFAYHRARGIPMKEIILNYYTTNDKINDNIVSEFIENLK